MDYLAIYKRLFAIAEAGLVYGKDAFDQERYTELRRLSLQLIQQLGNEPFEVIEELFAHEIGYQTPKIDVRAFITKKEKVLLVQDTKTKEWSLPGGYGDVGLSPKENIIKEVQEETNLLVTPNKLLAVFDTNLRNDIPQIFQYYKLVFACQVISNTQAFEKNIETSQMAYFGLNELPSLSKKRTTKEQLVQLFSQYETCYFE